jgi:hypothetical protein
LNLYKPFFIYFIFLLSACVSHPPAQLPESTNTGIKGDQYWTLDFFYFYKGKQTHTKAFEFVNRRDCFEAMYQMQVDAKKEASHSGSGICSKQFVEGQKRTHDDVLSYR